MTSTTARLTWGILGTGAIAKTFAKGLAKSCTGKLVAIGSRQQSSADAFVEEYGKIHAYGTYEELLADPEVQAVYVSTPHPSHAQWCIKAARAGKHILCEKPLTLNHAEAMVVVEAAREHDVFLMEAFMYRCHPQTAKLVELMENSNSRYQHHRFVLTVALRGGGKVCVETKTVPLREGECLLILPFQSHYFVEVSPNIHWTFITFDHPSDPRLEALRFRTVVMEERVLDEIAHFLRAWAARNASASFHLGCLIHLLTEKTPTRMPSHRPSSEEDDLLTRINQYAHENRYRTVSLRETSATLGVSSSFLRQKFHAMTGRSLGHYLRSVRLEYACNLLHNTRLQIGEIAEQCGYGSLFAFSRSFSDSYGCSPRAYRGRKV